MFQTDKFAESRCISQVHAEKAERKKYDERNKCKCDQENQCWSDQSDRSRTVSAYLFLLCLLQINPYLCRPATIFRISSASSFKAFLGSSCPLTALDSASIPLLLISSE